MVKVTFINLSFAKGLDFKKGSFNSFGFTVDGHSLFSKKGEDIVCSAVSALSLTTTLALKKLTSAEVESETRDGYLKTLIVKPGSESDSIRDIKVILNTFLIGIGEITNSYPGRLEITFKSEGE